MYHFKANIDNKNDESLVIFSGDFEGSSADFGADVDKILKLYTDVFSSVIYIFPKFLSEKFSSYYINDSFIVDVTRYKDVPILFYSFNEFSDLEINFSLHCKESYFDSNESILHLIIREGLLSLVESRKDKVILKSPPGTIFKKPSGDVYKEFIRASDIAVGSSENHFVAFCLLSKRPRNIFIRNIWTDTSGISSFISSLVFYLKKFHADDEVCIRYNSFQSYGGYEECEPANKKDVWVIISASSSNSLGRKIFSCWPGLLHEQILTVLSYVDEELNTENIPVSQGDSILCNISEYSGVCSNIGDIFYDMPVRIEGENFTVQIEPPNSVVLRKPHSPISINKFIRPVAEYETFECFRIVKNRTRPIYFNFIQYFNFLNGNEKKKNELCNWILNGFGWYAPFDIKYIIYDESDQQSKSFYDFITASLSADRGLSKKFAGLIRVDLNQVVSKIKNDGSVVIISPVISSGRQFLKINRDLRIVSHEKQRVFISLFSIFRSKNDYDLFSKSLILGPSGMKYQFLNYSSVFVGNDFQRMSWKNELDVVESFTSDIFLNRARKLRNESVGINGEIGFSLNEDKPLQFDIGFAFWDGGYSQDKVNHCSVYLTISCILQNLRDTPFSQNNKESLFKHVYQHSVLAPENFSRFNDGLLQSCLWRAADYSEVDYSETQELSNDFVDILVRLSEELLDGKFNALGDLLIGIAIKKIKIHSDSLVTLLSLLNKKLKEFPAIIELLYYIEVHVKKNGRRSIELDVL